MSVDFMFGMVLGVAVAIGIVLFGNMLSDMDDN